MNLNFNFPDQKFFNVAHVGVYDFMKTIFGQIMGGLASITSQTIVYAVSTTQDGDTSLVFNVDLTGVSSDSIDIERGGVDIKVTDPEAIFNPRTKILSNISNAYKGERFVMRAIGTKKMFDVYAYYGGGVSVIGAANL